MSTPRSTEPRDGISERSVPRRPAAEPRRRRRADEPVSEGMPLGLVLGLLAAGLLVCVALVAGLAFWIVSDLAPPAPIAAGAPAQHPEELAPFLLEPDWPNQPDPMLQGDLVAP